MRKLRVLAGVALAAGLLIAPSAWATMAYTLDATVLLNQDGVDGELRPVLDAFGFTDTSGTELTLAGSVDFATQDIFVIDIVLNAGSAQLDSVGITIGAIDPTNSPFPAPLVGIGYFDDGGGLIVPTSGVIQGFNNSQGLYVLPPLTAGQTTVRLFQTYAAGLAEDQQATFMISSGANFTVTGNLVPEPGTGVLVGMGLLAVAIRRRLR